MFGEFLILHGAITRDQLASALTHQRNLGLMLGETLVRLGYVPDDELELYLEKHLIHQADDIVNDPEIAI